jgi:uncharacterized protein
MKQSILISGASGLTGSALCRTLLDRGYKVIAISRNPEKAKKPWPSALSNIVSWNALPDIIRDLANSNQEYNFIHLAGAPIANGRWTKKRKALLWESRIGLSRKLVEQISQTGFFPKVFLQASAIGYYGSGRRGEITEFAPSGKGFLAALVREWEKSVAFPSPVLVRTVLLRTGIVLSPEGGVLKKMILPFRYYAGGPLGDGRQYLSWIHLEDWIESVIFLMNSKELEGPYNLTAPLPVTMNTFARVLGKQMKRPYFIRVPAFVLRIFLGTMAEELLLSGKKIFPEKLLQKGFIFKFTDINKALADLLYSNE